MCARWPSFVRRPTFTRSGFGIARCSGVTFVPLGRPRAAAGSGAGSGGAGTVNRWGGSGGLSCETTASGSTASGSWNSVSDMSYLLEIS